jgi:hypothetical protein
MSPMEEFEQNDVTKCGTNEQALSRLQSVQYRLRQVGDLSSRRCSVVLVHAFLELQA